MLGRGREGVKHKCSDVLWITLFHGSFCFFSSLLSLAYKSKHSSPITLKAKYGFYAHTDYPIQLSGIIWISKAGRISLYFWLIFKMHFMCFPCSVWGLWCRVGRMLWKVNCKKGRACSVIIRLYSIMSINIWDLISWVSFWFNKA